MRRNFFGLLRTSALSALALSLLLASACSPGTSLPASGNKPAASTETGTAATADDKDSVSLVELNGDATVLTPIALTRKESDVTLADGEVSEQALLDNVNKSFWSDAGDFFKGAADKTVDFVKGVPNDTKSIYKEIEKGTKSVINKVHDDFDTALDFAANAADNASSLANSTVKSSEVQSTFGWAAKNLPAKDLYDMTNEMLGPSLGIIVRPFDIAATTLYDSTLKKLLKTVNDKIITQLTKDFCKNGSSLGNMISFEVPEEFEQEFRPMNATACAISKVGNGFYIFGRESHEPDRYWQQTVYAPVTHKDKLSFDFELSGDSAFDKMVKNIKQNEKQMAPLLSLLGINLDTYIGKLTALYNTFGDFAVMAAQSNITGNWTLYVLRDKNTKGKGAFNKATDLFQTVYDGLYKAAKAIGKNVYYVEDTNADGKLSDEFSVKHKYNPAETIVFYYLFGTRDVKLN